MCGYEQHRARKKNVKKSPGSAFLETSCITTSKNPSSKNQKSSILGIWAGDHTIFRGQGSVLFCCKVLFL